MKFKTQLFSITLLFSLFALSCNSDTKKKTGTEDLDSSKTEIEVPKFIIEEYPELGFAAGFPGTPQKADNNGISMFQFVKNTEMFFIGVDKIGDEEYSANKALHIAGTAIASPDTISFGKFETPEGLEGDELILVGNVDKVSTYFVARIYQHNKTVYQLMVFTDGENPPMEKIEEFWSSFSYLK